MAFTDLFSTPCLFSITIIIILIGCLFAYVSYRLAKQDHKINSMVELVSTMAEESHLFRSKLNMLQQQFGHSVLPKTQEIQYASQMMGCTNGNDGLINVSDNEGNTDTDDDVFNDDEDTKLDSDISNNNFSDDDISDDDISDGNTSDDDDSVNNNNTQHIRRVNLKLDNADLNTKILYEDVDVSYKESNNMAFNSTADLIKVISTPDNTDIPLVSENNDTNDTNDITQNNDFLKNISITDFGDGAPSLGQIEDIHTHTSDYKKMSLNKLRNIVVSKGFIVDASKLKKNELIKLLGDK